MVGTQTTAEAADTYAWATHRIVKMGCVYSAQMERSGNAAAMLGHVHMDCKHALITHGLLALEELDQQQKSATEWTMTVMELQMKVVPALHVC